MKILGLLSLVFMISCSPKMAADQNATTSAEVLSYREQAYKVLKVSPVKFEENVAGDYVLATFIDNNKVPGAEPLRVAVINIASNKVTYQQNLNSGTVKWLGDYTIEIVAPPGIQNGNKATTKDYTYTIDVRTGKSINKVNVNAK